MGRQVSGAQSLLLLPHPAPVISLGDAWRPLFGAWELNLDELCARQVLPIYTF